MPHSQQNREPGRAVAAAALKQLSDSIQKSTIRSWRFVARARRSTTSRRGFGGQSNLDQATENVRPPPFSSMEPRHLAQIREIYAKQRKYEARSFCLCIHERFMSVRAKIVFNRSLYDFGSPASRRLRVSQNFCTLSSVGVSSKPARLISFVNIAICCLSAATQHARCVAIAR